MKHFTLCFLLHFVAGIRPSGQTKRTTIRQADTSNSPGAPRLDRGSERRSATGKQDAGTDAKADSDRDSGEEPSAAIILSRRTDCNGL